jgi:hypothetical protein
MAKIYKLQPDYRVDDFLNAMQFDPHGAALYRKGASLMAAR